MDGSILYEDKTKGCNLMGVFKKEEDFDCNSHELYLFAEYFENGEIQTVLYSPKFWDNVRFTGDYEVVTEKLNDFSVKVTVKACAFAKSVFISIKDTYKYVYSDNYIDVEKNRFSNQRIRF